MKTVFMLVNAFIVFFFSIDAGASCLQTPMNSSFALLKTAVVGNKACYVAQNPENIKIVKEVNSEQARPLVNYAVKTAMLMTYDFVSNEDHTDITHVAKLNLITKAGLEVPIVASQFTPDSTTYGVECDGGGIKVEESEQVGLKINTDYVRSDDDNYDVAFRNVSFVRTSCPVLD